MKQYGTRAALQGLSQVPSEPVPAWMQKLGWALVIMANGLILYRYFMEGRSPAKARGGDDE